MGYKMDKCKDCKTKGNYDNYISCLQEAIVSGVKQWYKKPVNNAKK